MKDQDMIDTITTLEVTSAVKVVAESFKLDEENAKQMVWSQIIEALDVKKKLPN